MDMKGTVNDEVLSINPFEKESSLVLPSYSSFLMLSYPNALWLKSRNRFLVFAIRAVFGTSAQTNTLLAHWTEQQNCTRKFSVLKLLPLLAGSIRSPKLFHICFLLLNFQSWLQLHNCTWFALGFDWKKQKAFLFFIQCCYISPIWGAI